MMNELFFYLSIFAAYIVQGVTGFAGAILALPSSSFLVGLGVAVPMLNGLGIVSGAYVLVEDGGHVDKRTLAHVMSIMIPCGVIGIFVRRTLSFDAVLLNRILGIIVLVVAVQGLLQLRKGDPAMVALRRGSRVSRLVNELIVCLSGVVHGMYACGGPLLVGYLTRKLPQKALFRSTVSAVWVVLNVAMLISQIVMGEWDLDLVRIQLIAVPFLLAGMRVGSIACRKVSQRVFTLLTYALLIVAALSLLAR